MWTAGAGGPEPRTGPPVQIFLHVDRFAWAHDGEVDLDLEGMVK